MSRRHHDPNAESGLRLIRSTGPTARRGQKLKKRSSARTFHPYIHTTSRNMSARAVGLHPRGGLMSRCSPRDGCIDTPDRSVHGQALRTHACVSPTASGEKRSGHLNHRRPVSLQPTSRRVSSWSSGISRGTVTWKASDATVSADVAPMLDPNVITVRATTDRAELRGAAAARALAFYTYPSDRSEFSIRSHRNMRIDAEWEAIREKIRGVDVAFRDTRVTCVVAALELPEDGTLPFGFQFDEFLDGACLIPAGDGFPSRLILGTCDVNQGAKLPAEELGGAFPGPDDPVPPGTDTSEDGKGTNKGDLADGEDSGSEGSRPIRYRRAYLSNVCVIAGARRLGLGGRLVRKSFEIAKSWGVEQMYVHVEAENVTAKRFYEKEGFEVVKEESEAFAISLQRPRRVLLSQPVGRETGVEA